ncbi:MAG: hypothetical protein AAF708_02780 [Deinococcota bacterium]
MNTPAHIVIAASAAKALPHVPLNSAVLIGSVAPDLPLYTLSCVAGLYFIVIKKMPPKAAARLIFDELFFHHPVWISLHNLLHAPLILVSAIVVSAWLSGTYDLARWWLWFFSSCLLHTLLDIPTHHNDGPLLLFPVNWQLRFRSPISYWDTAKGARKFMMFEVCLTLALTVYLVWM